MEKEYKIVTGESGQQYVSLKRPLEEGGDKLLGLVGEVNLEETIEDSSPEEK